ncbi:MAG: hypothetical protein ACRDON_02835 [Gaiellaceae bacterium]
MNGISEIFRNHPAGVLGALFAGPGQPMWAREDALPLPERPLKRRRLLAALRRRPLTAASRPAVC